MKQKRADEAVSEIVGTILLLGITVSLFSVICFVVLSYPFSPSSPSTNLVGMVEGEYLLIEHRGGKALDLGTKVTLTIGDNMSEPITVGACLNDESKEDNRWGIGEWFVYQNSDITGKKVGIAVVDVESDSVILIETFHSKGEC
jgi:flagellin-like protein